MTEPMPPSEPTTTDESRDLAAFARGLPKVELHCHLGGSTPASIAQELVDARGISLPMPVAELYRRCYSPSPDGDEYADTAVPIDSEPPAWVTDLSTTYPLQELVRMIAPAITDQGDFERITHGVIRDAVQDSAVMHVEVSLEPTLFMDRGIPFATIVDGASHGLRAAMAEFDLSGGLIVGIDRARSGHEATELVELAIEQRTDEVVGIGLQASEYKGPPERFVDAYRLAGRAGLGRTAHAAEHVPHARNVTTCLDLLGCDRIDHGYFVLEDPDVVARCRDEGTVFTVAGTTSRVAWRPWRKASIRRMWDQGLRLTMCADDPPMFDTTLAREYELATQYLQLSRRDDVLALVRNGIEASWADDARKREMTAQLAAATT